MFLPEKDAENLEGSDSRSCGVIQVEAVTGNDSDIISFWSIMVVAASMVLSEQVA